MESKQGSKAVSGLLLLGYIIFRFGLESVFWTKISGYWGYAFEILFIVAAFFTISKPKSFQSYKANQLIVDLPPLVIFGFLIYKLAGVVSIEIPLLFDNFELVTVLLVIAPVIEELTFRVVLWDSAFNLFQNAFLTLGITSLLFSLAHFIAYWSVPEFFQPFVIYQSIYTLVLGLIAGIRRMQACTPLASILTHFSFNLGFFIASNF